jgi:hypothetical protein
MLCFLPAKGKEALALPMLGVAAPAWLQTERTQAE